MSPSIYIAIALTSFIIAAIGISSYIGFKKKAGKEKQLKYFNDFIISNNLTIDSKQRFNKNIIGIDRLNFVVVFLNSETKNFQLIALKDLSYCQLVKERNKITGYITRIYLRCIFSNKVQENIFLCVCNQEDEDGNRMMRLSKRAEYWANKINIFRQAAALKNRYLLTA